MISTADMLLTKAQREVLAARAEGHGVKEIAFVRGTSVKAVEYHLLRARKRIGHLDIALMTQWALKHGVAKFVVAGLLLACVAQGALAPLSLPLTIGPRHPVTGSMTLAWDVSQDPTVIGYRLYYGVASGVYTNMVGTQSTQLVVGGLVAGECYYFAATALDASGQESLFSAEVSGTVPMPPPPINVVSLGFQVESSGDLVNWVRETNLVWLTMTNPSGNRFYRGGPTITNWVLR